MINDLSDSQENPLYLFADDSILCFDILQTDRLQPLASLQTLTKSQAGQKRGICLSILTNLTLTLSLTILERTIWQTLPSTFLTILMRKFSRSNSWVPLSAMIFLGQTTFQRWLPKPAADWASSVVQSSSLSHLNSCPPARPSTTA